MGNIKLCAIVTLSIVLLLVVVNGQLINPTKRYCFSFSWLGPKYNSESIFNNATCDDVTKLTNSVPCIQPLVVTYNGTFPNMTYVWENHDVEASCLLATNEVCASYEYKFDGKLENATFMCTKVVEDDGQSVTSGCYSNFNGNREIKVCVCRSNPGSFPCNTSTTIFGSSLLLILCLICVTLNFDIKPGYII